MTQHGWGNHIIINKPVHILLYNEVKTLIFVRKSGQVETLNLTCGSGPGKLRNSLYSICVIAKSTHNHEGDFRKSTQPAVFPAL